VGIPLTMGFRPQLVVVSGLSVGIPLTVGFRPQLVVVSGLSVGIRLMVGFRLPRSLRLSRSLFTNSSSFHDRILAITKPFTRTFSFFTMEIWLSGSLSHELFFLFSRWNSGYQEAFHTNFFLFSRWNSGYQEAFHTNFFSQWNSGYQEAFHTNFFLFSRWNFGYQEAFHTNFFLSHGRISAITEPFHEFFFHMVESQLSWSLFTNFSFTW
jgi:hypothetical protein